MKFSPSLSKRIKNLIAPRSLRKRNLTPKGNPDPNLTMVAATKIDGLGLGDLSSRISVLWNPRMRSTAGLAYPSANTIVLNPRLRDFGETEIQRTLLHELAHLVAQHRVGRKKIAPHGPEWQAACIDLGLLNESRCHDLPLPRHTMRRAFSYECPCCKILLERVRAFRKPAACLACCRKHSQGRYDERFKLVRIAPPKNSPEKGSKKTAS